MIEFRTLKEGDYVSAKEWNALVAFIKSMSRSSMTDGIMDSSGFHPRRKLISTDAPTLIANGPKTTNLRIDVSGSLWGFKPIDLNVYQKDDSCYLANTEGTEITLKKAGLYCFEITIKYNEMVASGTTQGDYSIGAILQWIKDEAWVYDKTTWVTAMEMSRRPSSDTGRYYRTHTRLVGNICKIFNSETKVRMTGGIQQSNGIALPSYRTVNEALLQIVYMGNKIKNPEYTDPPTYIISSYSA